MMKKIIATIMVIALCLTTAVTAFAIDAGEKRVIIGANLDDEQIAQVYRDFGIERGTVEEITVTNAEERKYLENLVPEGKIGSVSISCLYIETTQEGTGLTVSTNNINYCTSEMYVNALTTAGITDAKVIVSAPFAVSGTAALTGAYKAYEDITGIELSDIAKSVGAEELVLTGDLAQYIGSSEATELINGLKDILDQTHNMTDDEVRAEIEKLATQYNVELSDAQVDQLLKLCRKLEGLDTDELREKLVNLSETVDKANKVSQTVSKIGESVKSFFVSAGNWIVNLFGGLKK